MAEDTGTTTTSESITAPDAVQVKLPQTVEIKDVGPCKKHVKVTVERTAIDGRFDEKFSDLVRNSTNYINGFRPGKAPRRIIERRFKREVAADIKTEILMASLEQLAEEQAISPLSPPELDPNALAIPDAGPFVYEFDIEVRPEFDLPSYKGLKVRRPTHTTTDADVAREKARLLEPLGQVVPKPGDNPAVELNDIITADLTIKQGDRELNTAKEIRLKVEPKLALADGVAEKFGDQLVGAKAGDSRTVDITLSQELANPALRGQTVQAQFAVKDVKTVQPPELDANVLAQYGVQSPEALDEMVRVRLGRQLEYVQRQAARQQVFQTLAAGMKWELPQDLLRRQARKTLARKVMEMRSSGMTDDQIRGRTRVLENDAMRSTAAALQEHFVLQKIAELEKLEIEDADIDAEIGEIAERTGETYRKVKARMEKDDLIEALATELLERKALDLVLKEATYEDYEMAPAESSDAEVATSTAQAVSAEQAAGDGETPAANG